MTTKLEKKKILIIASLILDEVSDGFIEMAYNQQLLEAGHLLFDYLSSIELNKGVSVK